MADPAEPALLVVDDNEDNRYTLVRRLQRLGYRKLETAVNGREALERLAQQPFDLVLLDVTMPEMNGYEVLERLRADPQLRRVPVIMISALDQIDSVVRCIELGAEDYLAKPFNPTLLKARVGATLEKKRLRDEIDAHLARIEQELQWARRIQLGMVPERFPAPTPQRPIELHGTLRPARQVGGDLYDFFWRDEHRLCLVVADVSDKGAPAALFMANTKTLVRAVGTMLATPDGAPAAPHEIVARVNEELCRDNAEGMFVTLLLAVLDLRTLSLQYCNAGHPPPYVVDAGGGLARLEHGRGKALGIRPTFAYECAEIALATGSTIFLYTDGITEAEDAHGALFGDERLQQALHSAGAGAEAAVHAVIGRVQAFAGAAAQSDDIAALAARLVAAAGAESAPAAEREIVEMRIANRIAEIAGVSRRLDELGACWQLATDAVADLQVAIDEVLSNVIRHAYDDDATHVVTVRLLVGDDRVRVVVEDDGRPFDPFSLPAPDWAGSLHDRRVGGLGVHFVRQLMTRVGYEREHDTNRTTLERALGPAKTPGDGA